MEKARRMIEDLEEQSRAVEGGALSRHEFDSIRCERDTYKQNVIFHVKESGQWEIVISSRFRQEWK